MIASGILLVISEIDWLGGGARSEDPFGTSISRYIYSPAGAFRAELYRLVVISACVPR